MATRRIRVWIVGMPPLLADMVVGALGQDTEFELIATDASDDRAAPPGIDALLTAHSQAATEHLVRASPRFHAFVIGHEAPMVQRVRMCPVTEDLGDLSFGELGAAIKRSIRGAARASND